ncbi:MAG: hypothetical protein QM500_18215 [Methylococcales bacterium]
MLNNFQRYRKWKGGYWLKFACGGWCKINYHQYSYVYSIIEYPQKEDWAKV